MVNQTTELLVTLVKQLIIDPSLGNFPIMELHSLGEHFHRLMGIIGSHVPLSSLA